MKDLASLTSQRRPPTPYVRIMGETISGYKCTASRCKWLSKNWVQTLRLMILELVYTMNTYLSA
jgi:hypothetical protein